MGKPPTTRRRSSPCARRGKNGCRPLPERRHDHAEAAGLSEQLALLKKLLKTSPIGVLIAVEGFIRYSNPRARELMDLREEMDVARVYPQLREAAMLSHA